MVSTYENFENNNDENINNATGNSAIDAISSDEFVISAYLLKTCKLWVWDWDDCLINSAYYMKTSMEPDDIRARTDNQLTQQVPHLRYFKKLIDFLIQHGRYVGIASFGTYEIIQAYMDRIFGFNQKFFNKTNIIAPCFMFRKSIHFELPPDKNEYILKLMKFYKIEDFHRVVLFDDMPSNISQATAIGVIAIQIDTSRNGDSQQNQSKFYFGPHVMTKFDKQIENTCGKDIYLNRKYLGVVGTHDTAYTGITYDKIDFGSGVQEKFEPYTFGTGIGDRKISKKPAYPWNTMNSSNVPTYHNGNYYLNVEDSLGDISSIGQFECAASYNKYKIPDENSILYKNVQNINKKNAGNMNNNSTNLANVEEGFTNDVDDNDDNIYSYNKSNSNKKCNTCKGIKWSWIILVLLLVITFMIIVCWKI